ncbi:UDP-N-acetylmuramoyl-L-alanine--D-glutamate ligase [Pasteuria penetrans]|uniref:UDP-N-acetylmuramoyl-L-alanine--D-glutamate ligase n=1 Tax=Pasteuria penetrans TaxID=86005 RepID=UPI000FB5C7FB|nr:UDP-N-acetylmuramoyl-L-alanine--D-glutamate ligase [Pasteuria penetrans]
MKHGEDRDHAGKEVTAMLARAIELWKNRRALVIGLSQSGTASARLLTFLGAQVRVTEQRPLLACPEARSLQASCDVEILCGGHPLSVLEGMDVVIKNPGVPYRLPLVREILRRGLPMLTEIEVASSLLQVPLLAVTGSNGKTTTATWVHHMLENESWDIVVAGNVGCPLVDVVHRVFSEGKDVPDAVVLEVSSFQLKGTRGFHPKVAALLNVFPAHLDYHGTMADYSKSKESIFMNQTKEDTAVLPALPQLCELLPDLAARVPAKVAWFGADVEGPGAFTRAGTLWLRHQSGKEERLIEREKIRLQGDFNIYNAQAATVIAHAAGCSTGAIMKSLATFKGVPHRLMHVATIQGVRYYDDSKATNVTAVRNAIRALQGPILWIAGGVDRGEDFASLGSLLNRRLRCMLAYGQAQSVLLRRAEKIGCTAYAVIDVQEAVVRAHSLAQDGDVVLLSPGCASWDRYTSFEERGRVFQQAVHRLSR